MVNFKASVILLLGIASTTVCVKADKTAITNVDASVSNANMGYSNANIYGMETQEDKSKDIMQFASVTSESTGAKELTTGITSKTKRRRNKTLRNKLEKPRSVMALSVLLLISAISITVWAIDKVVDGIKTIFASGFFMALCGLCVVLDFFLVLTCATIFGTAIYVVRRKWNRLTWPIRYVNDCATQNAQSAGLLAWVYSLMASWFMTCIVVDGDWVHDDTQLSAFLTCAIGASLSAKFVYWMGYGETLVLLTGWRFLAISLALLLVGLNWLVYYHDDSSLGGRLVIYATFLPVLYHVALIVLLIGAKILLLVRLAVGLVVWIATSIPTGRRAAQVYNHEDAMDELQMAMGNLFLEDKMECNESEFRWGARLANLRHRTYFM
ncbi:hypothetical protein MPSEU_001092400 [Mayamaea pseudoterrestris]|nr:hypothetical protein MPSEU_000287000 [Mayamaea pseudoterrestris]GKZ01416.1 hypothetical protein MPSEU_001092400 [Mayamaea pseudoterrestris]